MCRILHLKDVGYAKFSLIFYRRNSLLIIESEAKSDKCFVTRGKTRKISYSHRNLERKIKMKDW